MVLILGRGYWISTLKVLVINLVGILLLKGSLDSSYPRVLTHGVSKLDKICRKINTRSEIGVCSRYAFVQVLRREDIYMSIHEEKNVSRGKCKLWRAKRKRIISIIICITIESKTIMFWVILRVISKSSLKNRSYHLQAALLIKFLKNHCFLEKHFQVQSNPFPVVLNS